MVNEKGETFFVGKDVAEALGYTNTLKAIRDHVDEDDKKDALIQGPPWWTSENDGHQRKRILRFGALFQAANKIVAKKASAHS